jgi:prephenate dehydrogenase
VSARTITIIGCGLIGGSLLKALSRQGAPLRAVDRDEKTRLAIHAELGLNAQADLSGVEQSQLIVLALPVTQLSELLPRLGHALAHSAGVTVTDVAGIKLPVIEAMERWLPSHVARVGGHPMAGKERGGYGEADAALFEQKTVALCPATHDADALRTVEQLWHGVGARTLVCDARDHDKAVARVSHLPYLVAVSLSLVAGRGDSLSARLAGGGLRDTSRVAADPTVRQAVTRNPNVAALAREVAAELLALANAIDMGQPTDEALDAAAASRQRLFPVR